jgi:purine-binding chemotaxis protein CheW
MEAVQQTRDKARSGQFLTFVTADEEYAVAILKVKEIVEYSTVTGVPNTPGWIRGVTNLRGNVVPVIDLAVKFGLPASKITKFSCIVITEVMSGPELLTLGVLADSVSQVLDWSENDIEDPPPFGTRVKLEYLLGLGRMDTKFCLILDIDKVLSTDELLAVAESAESADEANRASTSERRLGPASAGAGA